MTKTKVLIIDDESSIVRFLSHSLEANGFEVFSAEDGKSGLAAVVDKKPDLVILDFGLPDQTGIEVLRKMREWSKTPVIFLTVRDQDEDKVHALDSGADDYLTKPFSMPELMARLRVAMRHAPISNDAPLFKSGPLLVDRSAHTIKLDGHPVKLTATEYSLVSVLIKSAGKVVAHRTILSEVWGPNSVEHFHYLRVYFGQIRKKFEAVLPGAGNLIQTESAIGYRISTDKMGADS